MAKYAFGRVLLLIPTLLGMSILIFLMLRLLPGDIVDIIAGADPQADTAARQQLREAMGLADPIPVQYVRWLGDLLQGDPGTSLRSGQPVAQLLMASLPITVELAVLATLIATVVAIPLGVVSAVKRDTGLDFAARVGGLIGLSLPSFWIATLALLFTSKMFGWVPKTRYISPFDDPFGNLQQMILPALALAIQLMAIEMRMTRTTMLEVLGEDFVRTARAKGLRERLVVRRHVLRNALLPVITVSGLALGGLLGGSVAVERAFGVPGLGTALVLAFAQRDWMVIQNLVLLYGIVFTFVNLAIDVAYAVLDPRVAFR